MKYRIEFHLAGGEVVNVDDIDQKTARGIMEMKSDGVVTFSNGGVVPNVWINLRSVLYVKSFEVGS